MSPLTEEQIEVLEAEYQRTHYDFSYNERYSSPGMPANEEDYKNEE